MDSDETYCFVVEWFDDIAEITRDYSLTFWVKDNSVSMFDLKRRRMFLKRMVVDSLQLQDLFVGQRVVVLSRQLLIKEYGDANTRQYFVDQMKSAIIAFLGSDPFGNVNRFLADLPANVKVFKLRSIRADESLESFCPGVPNGSTVIAASLTGKDAATFAEQWHASNALSTKLLENVEEVSEYMFRTAQTSAQISNCTLCLIKPHVLSESNAGALLNKILTSGFSINAIQMFQLSPHSAEQFYEVYKGVVKQYSDILEEFLSGPVIALEISREDDNENTDSQNRSDIVTDFRNLVGPHDPHVAKHIRSHTIRAEFGRTRVQNGVHCTDLSDDGILECQYFFSTLQS